LNRAQAYLKFDLNSIGGSISKAVLRLTPLATGRTASSMTMGVQLLKDADDAWVEGAGGKNSASTGPTTWLNAPDGSGKWVLVAGAKLKACHPISIDVTSLVNQRLNKNRIAGFELDAVSRFGGGQWVAFASRESASVAFRPALVVTADGPITPPPTVVQEPTASSKTATTVQLAVLGAAASGEQGLAYTWSAVSSPGAAAPTFSDNGGNASKNTTAAFHQAGTYVFTATITDLATGLSTRSGPVTVRVDPSLANLRVAPSDVTLGFRATQQFAAQGLDQFGRLIPGSLAGVTWSVAGAGTIGSGTGAYAAPGTATADTIIARAGSLSATTTVTVVANPLGLKDAALGSLVQGLYADGSISRQDMLAIFRSERTVTNGVIGADDWSDLRTIFNSADTLNMPDYVEVLAGDVINGNRANARFQGRALGNLAVGSTAAHLGKLVSKWFLGADRPAAGGLVYSKVAGSLFTSAGPSHHDERQGYLGDCYLISALGAIADSSQAAIRNMFIDNGVDNRSGVHCWTVRFYVNGRADYVTVDDRLPTDGRGYLMFQGVGSSVHHPKGLWLALAEKAYAQWNETGNEGRDGANRYSSIEGGWMAEVDAQVLGRYAASYWLSTSSDRQALVAGLAGKMAVTIATTVSSKPDGSLPYGLYGNHAYAVIGYNGSDKTFTLYNPWGTAQPTRALTWAELKSVCDAFVVADPSRTKPIAAASIASAALRSIDFRGDVAVGPIAPEGRSLGPLRDRAGRHLAGQP
jgi:hypothetical protein